ncbi:MAG: sigma-54-dependent Fis family transcriptional regulator [Desulfobacteraceae bacterium]
MNRKPALIIHPEDDFCHRIKRMLLDLKCEAQVCTDSVPQPAVITEANYRLVAVHEEMVMADEENLSSHLLINVGHVPVIIFSDQIDVRRAVDAVQKGAFDYFTKDSSAQAIQTSLARAVKLTDKGDKGKPSGSGLRSIVSRSDAMATLLATAERVAKSNATVLIEGESGTGKELLARFIHQKSGRSAKAFVAMNCAALPENLVESELFGYDKGAFTGATKRRIGKFEQASGGTLLLDEISEMPLALQAKLLRVLQEKEVDPIGGHKPIPVDVRLLATCNRDLAQMVKEGSFRQDLYYRLRVIPLKIPSLRERKSDISILVEHFKDKFCNIHNIPDVNISSEAMSQLSGWSWPGNVRELENTIERAILICDGSKITPAHLLIDRQITAPEGVTADSFVGMTVKEIEKKLIGQTLRHVNENRTHAAQMLGISIRTLRNKLREYAHTDEPPSSASGNNV